jgi:hypothetical protein
MKLETFAEYLKLEGKKVISGRDYIWYSVGKGFYQSFPFHKPIYPSWREMVKVLFGGPAIGLRFQTDDPKYKGWESFIYIADKGSYALEKLSTNTRSKIRRGLKHCRIGQIKDFNYFCTYGWQLNLDTLKRQNRSITKETERCWNCLARMVGTLPGLEVWGAWVEESLASFVVCFKVEDCCNLMMFRSATNYLRFYPNNALIYSVVTEMLSRNDIALVSFGLESIKNIEGLDTFKISMGFQKRFIYQKIVLNPLIGWCFNKLTKQCISYFAHYLPSNMVLKNAVRIIHIL